MHFAWFWYLDCGHWDLSPYPISLCIFLGKYRLKKFSFSLQVLCSHRETKRLQFVYASSQLLGVWLVELDSTEQVIGYWTVTWHYGSDTTYCTTTSRNRPEMPGNYGGKTGHWSRDESDVFQVTRSIAMADPRRRHGCAPPPGPNSFIFIQFPAKNCKIIG